MVIFHKKASSQHYLINVLSAVIRGFVPVWIDGVMCLYVGVYELYVVHTEGAELIYSWDLLRSLSWTLFKSEVYDSGAIQQRFSSR